MALLFASLWVDSAWDYVRQAPFDAVTWRDRQVLDSQDSWRSRMVNDLLDEHDFTGWRRDDVVTLLGEPDDVSRVADYDMGYFLGPDDEPFVVERWLVFTLDGNGRVLDYQVLPIKF